MTQRFDIKLVGASGPQASYDQALLLVNKMSRDDDPDHPRHYLVHVAEDGKFWVLTVSVRET